MSRGGTGWTETTRIGRPWGPGPFSDQQPYGPMQEGNTEHRRTSASYSVLCCSPYSRSCLRHFRPTRNAQAAFATLVSKAAALSRRDPQGHCGRIRQAMRSLDTKVLVRYLAADHPRQCAAAERVIEESIRNREPLYLTVIVLCEFVWVLSGLYRQSKPQIADHLEQILGTPQFSIEQDSLVRRACMADGQRRFLRPYDRRDQPPGRVPRHGIVRPRSSRYFAMCPGSPS